MDSISDVVNVLITCPLVIGLIECGSARRDEEGIVGDYDLIAILETRDRRVESLHFFAGNLPVDLGLKTLVDIRHMDAARGEEAALLNGNIIYDPTGAVAHDIENLGVRDTRRFEKPRSFAPLRHHARHIHERILAHRDSMPGLCHHLVQGNVYWLVRQYFEVRHLDFQSEPHAFDHFQAHEPELLEAIRAFHGTTDLEEQIAHSDKIAAIVLAPVGGMWRDGELLVFGDFEKGAELFGQLFAG